ncbi:hypothetical protein MUN76_15165 [Leucobacter rhizosphaerae]|uniref:Uncharacterized protein n=1 Tax=Leucobacter rhizosphaerae TaxID=2932245 RepID=A0ABY4FVM1_9MICO|nr:hypothetical protein [Leucobacter rhizosphaerae]UOQ60349.1 hypothetical protein MUN76_15165 [Leucobacter rhizosphaerae]
MKEIYEKKAAEAAKMARMNRGFGWFYLVMTVANVGAAVGQIVFGNPPINLIVAAVTAAMWLMNKRTVSGYEQSARDYRSAANASIF